MAFTLQALEEDLQAWVEKSEQYRQTLNQNLIENDPAQAGFEEMRATMARAIDTMSSVINHNVSLTGTLRAAADGAESTIAQLRSEVATLTANSHRLEGTHDQLRRQISPPPEGGPSLDEAMSRFTIYPMPQGYDKSQVHDFHRQTGSLVKVYYPPEAGPHIEALFRQSIQVKSYDHHRGNCAWSALSYGLKFALNQEFAAEDLRPDPADPRGDFLHHVGLLASSMVPNRESSVAMNTFETLQGQYLNLEDVHLDLMRLVVYMKGRELSKKLVLGIIGWNSRYKAYVAQVHPALLEDKATNDPETVVWVYSANDSSQEDKKLHGIPMLFNATHHWAGIGALNSIGVPKRPATANSGLMQQAMNKGRQFARNASVELLGRGTPGDTPDIIRNDGNDPIERDDTPSLHGLQVPKSPSRLRNLTNRISSNIFPSSRSTSANDGGTDTTVALENHAPPAGNLLPPPWQEPDWPATLHDHYGWGWKVDIGSDPKSILNKEYLSEDVLIVLADMAKRSKAVARNKKKNLDDICLWHIKRSKRGDQFPTATTQALGPGDVESCKWVCKGCRDPRASSDTNKSGQQTRQCAVLMDNTTLLIKGYTPKNDKGVA